MCLAEGGILALDLVLDVEADAELTASQLVKGGFNAICQRVNTAQQLTDWLGRERWDLVLTDYAMPDLAVSWAAMKLGMAEFVSKNNLDALGPVVMRVLEGRRLGAGPVIGPRVRLSSSIELQVVEWSGDRRMLDGKAPLRPGHVRDARLLDQGEATRMRVRVLGCEVQAVTPCSVVYRSKVALV